MIRSTVPLVSLLFTFFVALPVQAMRCQETTIRHYVNCEDKCFAFSDPAVLQKITNCTAKERFGCLLRPCLTGFECVHDPDHPFPLCGNDKTIFDQFHVDSASQGNPVKFLVDVNAPPLKVQYYFLVDTSKSMAPHLHLVKKKINDLIDMYKTMPEIDASFALGEFRDPRFGGSPRGKTNGQCGLRHIRSFTKDKPWIQRDVNGLATASTGGGGPEGLLPSILQAATNSGWATGTRKILVVFGDAPGFETSKHDLFWLAPGTVPWIIGRSDVATVLKNNEVVYVGVSIGDVGLDGPTLPWTGSLFASVPPSSTPGQSTFLAKETGGVVTSPSKTLMEAVIHAKESYEREYTMDASECSPKLVINDGKEFRVNLKPSTGSTVDMTMVLNDKFCDPFDCNIKYFEDGVQLVPLNMKFLKISGCPPILP